MLPPWRHHWLQAQAALTAGNLEQAAEHLAAIDATACGAEARLAAEVAEQLARRALERAAEGVLPLALDDLRMARRLGGRTPLWQQLARAVVEATLQRAIRQWTEGNAQAPREAFHTLASARDLELRLTELAETTRRLELAHGLARRGKFLEARRQLAAVHVIAPHAVVLAETAERYQQQARHLEPLAEQLHSAMAAEDWSTALTAAQELLAVAPEHPQALAARQQARAAREFDSHAERNKDDTQVWARHPRIALDTPTAAPAAVLPSEAASFDPFPMQEMHRPGSSPRPTRLMLWVDGVGSFLALLSDQVTIGPASFRRSVDLPIQADLSRRHARIVRRQQEYWVEPLRGQVHHGGTLLAGPLPLTDGDELVLGSRVRLRFRQPHPLSCTARLELLSHHRTVPLADAVLLAAHTCILGPDPRSHVVCHESTEMICVTHEPGGVLKCHSKERLEVDGQPWEAHQPMRLPARVTGSGISFLLEEV